MGREDPVGLRVRSGDAVLLDRLGRPTGPGSVHSVFARTVNVQLPTGFLISLATADAGDAPRTLTVELADWTALPVAAGQAVAFAPGSVHVLTRSGPLRLDTTRARKWHAISPAVSPALAARGPDGFERAAADLERIASRHGARGGMLGPAPGAGPMELAVAEALRSGRDTLLAAVRAGDPAGLRRGVLALLGLGPGLTPAGDDFLVGLTLLAALPGSALASLVPVVRDVLAGHAGRTTDVSAATLAEAADGRARGDLLDLLALLAADGPPRDPAAAVRRVLALGHTSGADTVSGLAAGLRLESDLSGLAAGRPLQEELRGQL